MSPKKVFRCGELGWLGDDPPLESAELSRLKLANIGYAGIGSNISTGSRGGVSLIEVWLTGAKYGGTSPSLPPRPLSA